MSFKAFEQDDFVVSADSITAGLWTGNQPILTTFITSSTQVASSNGDYYFDLYRFYNQSSSTTSQIAFELFQRDETTSIKELLTSKAEMRHRLHSIYVQEIAGDKQSIQNLFAERDLKL